MDHNFVVEGYGLRLRPVAASDASFIYEMRQDSQLNEFVGNAPKNFESQITWQKEYMHRAGDFYFIIEIASLREPIGTIALYELSKGAAEWGRWILKSHREAACASAILIYDFGFEVLSLDKIYCRTVDQNSTVLGFHRSFGASYVGVDGNVEIKNKNYGLIRYEINSPDWQSLKSKNDRLAKSAARFYQ